MEALVVGGGGVLKGHLVCIEILKAKAAIKSDRLYTSKAQQEVESRERRGSNERSSSQLLPFLSSSQDSLPSD